MNRHFLATLTVGTAGLVLAYALYMRVTPPPAGEQSGVTTFIKFTPHGPVRNWHLQVRGCNTMWEPMTQGRLDPPGTVYEWESARCMSVPEATAWLHQREREEPSTTWERYSSSTYTRHEAD